MRGFAAGEYRGVFSPGQSSSTATFAPATTLYIYKDVGVAKAGDLSSLSQIYHTPGEFTGSAAHDYIALYSGDRGAFVASLTTIRDTAAQIIAALEPAAKNAEKD